MRNVNLDYKGEHRAVLRGKGGGGLHQNSLEIDFIVVSGRRE